MKLWWLSPSLPFSFFLCLSASNYKQEKLVLLCVLRQSQQQIKLSIKQNFKSVVT